MEKLSLETFRALKQEVINYVEKYNEASERGEDLSEEEEEQFIERYKDILKTLSEHDLSDIDFEEWQGMYLSYSDEIPLDFSKTKANLDFGVIMYEGSSYAEEHLPNFKGCQIKNFDFEKNTYSPEMFDEPYRKENQGRFLSESIPNEVSAKFYKGQLTLGDIQSYSELANKISEKNVSYGLRQIYGLIGREEFCKLDAEFVDTVGSRYSQIFVSNPEIKTAEEIMPILYQKAREGIIGYTNDDSHDRFYHTQDELGERFKELNPDLFLDEDAPEDLKTSYYRHMLSIGDFGKNLQYFEGKKVAHSFAGWGDEAKLVDMYGDEIIQLYKDYGPIISRVMSDWLAMRDVEVPVGPITEEQRKEIVGTGILNYFIRNGFGSIENWNEFKMVLDFVPLENLAMTPGIREMVDKYGIDTIIDSGIDSKYVFQDTLMSDVGELASIKGIEKEDLKRFVVPQGRAILDRYDISTLGEYGIKDLTKLNDPITDVHQIKKMLEQRPIDLIDFGKQSNSKINFIQKYGIDNIIAMDEETGLFSHELWGSEIYLRTLADADGMTRDDNKQEYTYNEFKDRMYQVLLQARRNGRGIFHGGDYPGYDFVQGDFREEHQDIFIDENADEEVKREFYSGRITAESFRKHPELAKLLKGKDLEAAFEKKQITAGIGLIGPNGMGIPNIVNMAKYLSEQLGEEEFFKLCSDYGKCLDNINFGTPEELTPENLRATIEEAIYKGIKENGLEYFEDLPESFKSEHPDLFLPEEIAPEIREKFYAGKLQYEDIRKNPELKDIILAKDVSVGFGKTKYGQTMLARPGQRYINPLWENLSEKEILDFAEVYGRYFGKVDDEAILKGENVEERDAIIRQAIEENIINRKDLFGPKVPEFFKEKYPNMFLDSNAPAELKELYYDKGRSGFTVMGGHLTFEEIKAHPEWKEFLQGKDLRRGFSQNYDELFKRFDGSVLLKLGTRNPQMMELMVANHRESTLENWYKATGGKFVPHHVVMLNFPETEIDSFLGNSKKWSQLMKIDRYNLNDDGKDSILKIAYAMGVFQGNDDGFNKTMELFTQIPRELSQEEYDSLIKYVSENPFDEINDSKTQSEGTFEPNLAPIQEAYTQNENGTYVLRINQQQEKEKIKELRGVLERSGYPKILTPEKAHLIFGGFKFEYNPDFVKFFNRYTSEILSNTEYQSDISKIQRQFVDIVRNYRAVGITLNRAQDYIKSVTYNEIDIGNESMAEEVKSRGYSQEDFEKLQKLFNEGEMREFSSIPKIEGKNEGYTYEMLRCDDPLALTIGNRTDCCQAINEPGETSMEHSVVSQDGRVFCVRDLNGEIVAQSWFWRNQYTGCFDNIEIPHRIFELFEREHPEQGRKGLTQDVLEVYKKAAQELMQEDEKVYSELLENGTITQEQYDSLLLGKVTIGLGYNDIADAIKTDKTIHQDKDTMQVKKTDRLPHPYTDASTQYTIAEREGIVKASEPQENLYVYQDSIPEYDASNISTTTLLTMKRMEQSVNGYNLAYLDYENEEGSINQSQKIMSSISREYGLNPEDTKVLATARIAMIYSKAEDKIKIGDIFSSPIKSDLTLEQQQRAEEHIRHQMKKALNQIGVHGSEVDLSLLNENQRKLLQDIIEQIEKENDERGER